MITDEMVEKAVDAYDTYVGDPAELGCNSHFMRAALEAVAPLLIAQGMREAASIAGIYGELTRSEAILARAQEIDPK